MRTNILQILLSVLLFIGCTTTTEGLDKSEIISASTDKIEVDCNAKNVMVSVSSQFPYEIVGNYTWISTSITSGNSGTSEFILSVHENESATERSGKITLRIEQCPDIFFEIMVQQEAGLPYIHPSKSELQYPGDAINSTILIESNVQYAISSSNSWCRVSELTGYPGRFELGISADANPSATESRTATITLENSNCNLSKQITVTQGAIVPTINIDCEKLDYTIEGGTQAFVVTANAPNFTYDISTDQDWIYVSQVDNNISVTVPLYLETKERSGSITILNKQYDISKTIQVSQKGITTSDLNRIIFYTSSDNSIVTPYKLNFDATIVINTYSNDRGAIIFDKPITSIGEFAFYYCTSLTSVTIGNSVTSIGDWAFEDCTSLTSVTIPDSVTSIGDSAFSSCTSLTSITIPDSVTSIGDSAFSSCTSLTRVDITDLLGWCKIGFGGYSANPLNNGAKLYLNGSELTDITIPSDITEIKQYTFHGCTSLTSVTIPDSVTSIGEYAFAYCTLLTSVTIPDSVTSIGDHAFYNCTSLTSVTIPDSVTSIGNWAFYSCTSLISVHISNLSAWCKIYFESGANPLSNYGAKLYVDNNELTEVTIPSDITSIGQYVFCGYSSLTSVTIPDSVTSIGEDAFNDCSSLINVTIGARVTSIREQAFRNCISLTSITIPQLVTSIGDYAFRNCTSLKEVYCKPQTPPSGGYYMFNNNAPGRKIYVPKGSLSDYKADYYYNEWNDYASDIVGYDF